MRVIVKNESTGICHRSWEKFDNGTFFHRPHAPQEILMATEQGFIRIRDTLGRDCDELEIQNDPKILNDHYTECCECRDRYGNALEIILEF